MSILFKALPTETVRALQSGGADSNRQKPERCTSDGVGIPCRHCLRFVQKDRAFLTIGHRPFESVQPYAETGPIYLCADACERRADSDALPDVMKTSPQFIIRGYSADERICYGTGKVVATADIVSACETMFEDVQIAFIHIRSASNNCFYCRVERA
ncbi:DUF1203 domain-containing protein [Hoeflea poritis]|uniref:DUF1203 domain-containing protein n=1 Tax=Hoeflea poritis TaxID=2993659 RepID=A0ABT4VNE1_9HYPH|nr:DUF1203 domain-containing protein [Hoeflea poritis]MDA4846223.1 DUF1203 domain-containing protein [Hoeflea poritis]